MVSEPRLIVLCPLPFDGSFDGWHGRGEIAQIGVATELFAEGLGLSAIARQLTERGIPTARGGKWWASTVASVLNERKPTARKAAELPTVRRARRRKRPTAA